MSLDALTSHRPDAIQQQLPALASVLEGVVLAIELFAVAILLIGVIRFAVLFAVAELRSARSPQGAGAINEARVVLGRYILSALEVFIVADLLLTVLSFTVQNLIFLAALVLIRAVVSWFLELELRALRDHRDG